MPNWCEGKLKIRGRIENIVQFFERETVWINFDGTKEETPNITVSDGIISFLPQGNSYLKIKNTDRNHFLCNEGIYILYFNIEDLCEDIVCLDFRCPWKFETEPLIQFSKRYHLDFKAYLFESGAKFNCDLEIIDGELVKNEIVEFKNYVWECINPELGG